MTAGSVQSGVLSARFPAEQLPPGRYELRAEAIDGAGNIATSTLRGDGEPMVLEAPLRAPTLLRAWLRSKSEQDRRLNVRYADQVSVAGRLSRPDGEPLGGRLVRVAIRPATGARQPAKVMTVRSGPNGAFKLDLEPGTSRRLEVRFAGSANLASSAAGELRLAVRSQVGLAIEPSAVSTGERIRISGQVMTRGAKVPRRGKLVEIQYFESDAQHWRPVTVTRSDRRGHFSTRYRFRYVSGRARILMRALVPAEAAWPYGPGRSKPVVVRVRGAA